MPDCKIKIYRFFSTSTRGIVRVKYESPCLEQDCATCSLRQKHMFKYLESNEEWNDVSNPTEANEPRVSSNILMVEPMLTGGRDPPRIQNPLQDRITPRNDGHWGPRLRKRIVLTFEQKREEFKELNEEFELMNRIKKVLDDEDEREEGKHKRRLERISVWRYPMVGEVDRLMRLTRSNADRIPEGREGSASETEIFFLGSKKEPKKKACYESEKYDSASEAETVILSSKNQPNRKTGYRVDKTDRRKVVHGRSITSGAVNDHTACFLHSYVKPDHKKRRDSKIDQVADCATPSHTDRGNGADKEE